MWRKAPGSSERQTTGIGRRPSFTAHPAKLWGAAAAALQPRPYGAIDQSWQVLLSHIQRSALVPFAVPQLTSSRTMPLFSTTSS